MPSAARRRQAGFTLAEVLAALAFMAIVIPAAVEGLRIANLAGVVAERKSVAVRIAERVLNERTACTGETALGSSGSLREGPLEYRWTLTEEPWPQDTMQLVTVEVLYLVQEREYDLRLSSLIDLGTTVTSTNTSSASGSTP